VSGLYLEGAAWDLENCCLIRPKPKELVQDLPVLKGKSIFYVLTDSVDHEIVAYFPQLSTVESTTFC